MIPIIAQSLGILAMGFNIFSFQCKKNKQLIALIGVGSCLFSLSYLLSNALASAGFNIVNIFRSVSATNKKMHNNIIFALLFLAYILVAILTFNSVWTIFLLSAQLVETFAMWYTSGDFIRKARVFYISPMWLINNIFMWVNIGGIICEVFMIASVIVSYFRFGKIEEK